MRYGGHLLTALLAPRVSRGAPHVGNDEAVMLSRIDIIAIIVVVDLAPIHCHFRSKRPQAQQPLYQDDHTATGPAHLLTKKLFVAVVVVF